jgi:hypothetical protein
MDISCQYLLERPSPHDRIPGNLREHIGFSIDAAKEGELFMLSFDTPNRHFVNFSSSKGITMRRFVAIALSSTLLVQTAPLLAAPANRGTRAGGVQAPPATGTISGTAQSSTGEPLPKYTVRVRNLQTGQLAGTTTSSAAGGFSFAGLSPASYVVEVISPAGVIVGSSPSIVVAAGATVTVAVTATAATAIAGAAAGGAAGGGISNAVVVTTIAVAAGIAGVIVVVKNNASPSR